MVDRAGNVVVADSSSHAVPTVNKEGGRLVSTFADNGEQSTILPALLSHLPVQHSIANVSTLIVRRCAYKTKKKAPDYHHLVDQSINLIRVRRCCRANRIGVKFDCHFHDISLFVWVENIEKTSP